MASCHSSKRTSIDQVAINRKAAPSEKPGMMLKFIPVDLKEESHQDASLPPPWPTGCSPMQDGMKSSSRQDSLFIKYYTQTSPMMEPLCNHRVRLIIYITHVLSISICIPF